MLWGRAMAARLNSRSESFICVTPFYVGTAVSIWLISSGYVPRCKLANSSNPDARCLQRAEPLDDSESVNDHQAMDDCSVSGTFCLCGISNAVSGAKVY